MIMSICGTTLSLLLLCGAVYAQSNVTQATIPSITASGDAVIQAQPDRARIDLGVVSQASTAQEASAQNAKQVEQVLAGLREALPDTKNIRTRGYSLHPNYHHPRDGGQPTITGYTASNIVEITVDDVKAVGEIVDSAIKAGANNVNGLEFMLRNEQEFRSRALGEAATKARANAESLAAALGLKVARVLHVQEGSPAVIRPVREIAMQRMAADAGSAVPMEPGTIEVRAQVTLTVEVRGQ